MALAEDLVDPAQGLVVYDLTDDCINVFDGTDWKDLCDQSGNGGGSGGAGILSTGRFPWANTVPFRDMSAGASEEDASIGISQSGDVYVWGVDSAALSENFVPSDDSSVTDAFSYATPPDEYLYTPFKFDDPKLNGKTIKASYSLRTFMALNDDGEVWGYGRDFSNLIGTSSSRHYPKLREISYPTLAASDKIKDFQLTTSYMVLLTEEGRVFVIGTISVLGTHTEDFRVWVEVAKPSCVNTSTFKYTRILNKNDNSDEAARAVYIEGVDNGTEIGVYAIGEEIDQYTKTFADTSRPETGTDITTPSGITKINFPPGVTIKHIRVNDGSVIAITTDGELYFWGLVGFGSTPRIYDFASNLVQVSDIEATLTFRHHVVQPKLLPLPAGLTSIRDAYIYEKISSHGPVIVGDNGKVYFQGAPNGFTGYLSSPLINFREEFQELWSFSGVDVKELIVGEDAIMALDMEGQVWGAGDQPTNSPPDGFMLFYRYNTGTAAAFSQISNYALPLTDTAFNL